MEDELEYSQNNNLTTSSSSSGDDWESDEEVGKDIQYQPLPQDPPIENGENSDANISDDEIDEV